MASIRYQKELDGLRALAAMAVFWHHVRPDELTGGFFGVDVFFVLSGFLIAKIILNEIENGTFSFVDFYRRRVRRLVPEFLLMLVAVSVVAVTFFDGWGVNWYEKTLWASVFQVANLFFFHEDGSSGLNPLRHVWSLSIEWQFYLFFAPFFYFSLKFGRKFAFSVLFVGFLVSFFWNCYLFKENWLASFVFFSSRLWEFLLGAMLAFAKDDERGGELKGFAGIFALGLIFLSFFAFKHGAFFALVAIWPCLGVILVIWSSSNVLISGLLGNRLMVFCGKGSYSFYLWHYPVVIFSKYFFDKDALVVVLFFVCVTISCLSYLFYQKCKNY